MSRHDGEALVVEWIVEADSYMAMALFDELFKLWDDADGTHSDAFGTPGKTPFASEDLGGGKYVVVVVHGFSHSHVDDIGQILEFGYAEYLIQYLGSREVSVESLSAGNAELAVHLASFLAGDAEGGSVFLGEVYGLYELAVFGREEVLLCSVFRYLAVYGRPMLKEITFFEFGSYLQGKVGHVVDALASFVVKPVAYLFGCKGRESLFGTECLELGEGQAE